MLISGFPDNEDLLTIEVRLKPFQRQ